MKHLNGVDKSRLNACLFSVVAGKKLCCFKMPIFWAVLPGQTLTQTQAGSLTECGL